MVPGSAESRHDIIQAVELGSKEAMVAFCKGIQSAAAVDSYVTPEPWAMPGYESEVIMAAGAFVQGSSIELSADGPIRPLRGLLPGRSHLVSRQAGHSFEYAKSWRTPESLNYKIIRSIFIYVVLVFCDRASVLERIGSVF